MKSYEYKQVVNKAFECGSAKYDLRKTEKVLHSNFGTDLVEPKGYEGLTIMEAYFQGYQK
jgi:hypothetical protein